MNSQSQLDSVLKRMADSHQPELPSPSLIWWRAQILRRQQEQARIERPVMIMRLLATVVCVVAFSDLVGSNWQVFQTWMGNQSWLLWLLGIVALAASVLSASLLWPAVRQR